MTWLVSQFFLRTLSSLRTLSLFLRPLSFGHFLRPVSCPHGFFLFSWLYVLHGFLALCPCLGSMSRSHGLARPWPIYPFFAHCRWPVTSLLVSSMSKILFGSVVWLISQLCGWSIHHECLHALNVSFYLFCSLNLLTWVSCKL